MLRHPIPSEPSILRKDSSGFGLVGVHSQQTMYGEEYVKSFESRSLKGPELIYTTTKKELLAIIYWL